MWWNNYVGIPFKWLGNTREGCSCWGLVQLVLKEVFHKDIPRMEELERQAMQGSVHTAPYQDLGLKVEAVQSGDVVHMLGAYPEGILPLHCGIVTKPGYVLHVETDSTSIIEHYMRQPLQKRVLGFYRAN